MTARAALGATARRQSVNASPSRVGRFWEIDVARTIALAMMVTYHAVYDIDMLSPGLGPDPFLGGWGALPEATASLFLLVAGASLAVSDARMRARGDGSLARLRRHLRRAAVIMAAAVVVSGATAVAFDDRYVRFGILHAIAAGTVVAALTVRLGFLNAPIGVAVLVGALTLPEAGEGSAWLLPLGVVPAGFSSVDYWPLVPWLGPLLVGVALGRLLYPGGGRGRLIGRLDGAGARAGALTVPARHSLTIYLVHQLVLVPLVWAILLVSGAEVWSPA
ncbi:heparan-alpha-glucosaminide N-acetyltransferase [Miltoncostaea marina]|uniref:heparan-alpha-glucosaminide N-acetyltransferase n=1 Tax=Miltoncostaea marina TaxID=2843215 RepID=UPI002484C97B|nr:heparan-alpha-glucosaminide N-acetyltransferase [Miltoncostaea marina]